METWYSSVESRYWYTVLVHHGRDLGARRVIRPNRRFRGRYDSANHRITNHRITNHESPHPRTLFTPTLSAGAPSAGRSGSSGPLRVKLHRGPLHFPALNSSTTPLQFTAPLQFSAILLLCARLLCSRTAGDAWFGVSTTRSYSERREKQSA